MSLIHLVGHDGTSHGDDALALARTVGAGRDVHRIVLHVLTYGGPTTVVRAEADALPKATQAPVRRIREALQAGETLEVVTAESHARGLHDRAEELEADLVAVGSRSREPLGHELTPVAYRLLSGGPCSVLHAPAGYAERVHTLARVVVGYDRSPEAGDALAEAGVLAAAAGATVDVVHAHTDFAMPGYPGAVYVLPEEYAAADEESARIASEGLEALPESLRGISVGRRGTPGAVLDAFAAEQGADLVVVGSRGYGPLRRTLLGSASGHLLRRATCPVLVLPRGATERTSRSTGGDASSEATARPRDPRAGHASPQAAR